MRDMPPHPALDAAPGQDAVHEAEEGQQDGVDGQRNERIAGSAGVDGLRNVGPKDPEAEIDEAPQADDLADDAVHERRDLLHAFTSLGSARNAATSSNTFFGR